MNSSENQERWSPEIDTPTVSMTSLHIEKYLTERKMQIIQWFLYNHHVVFVWVAIPTSRHIISFFIEFLPQTIEWIQTTETHHTTIFADCQVTPASTSYDNYFPYFTFFPTMKDRWVEISKIPSMIELHRTTSMMGMMYYHKGTWWFVSPTQENGKTLWTSQDFISKKTWSTYFVRFEFFDECKESAIDLLLQCHDLWEKALHDRLIDCISQHASLKNTCSTSCLHRLSAECIQDLSSWSSTFEKWNQYLRQLSSLIQQIHDIIKALSMEWESLDDEAQCPRYLEKTLSYADRKKKIYQTFDKTKLLLKHAYEAYTHTFIHIMFYWNKTWWWTRIYQDCYRQCQQYQEKYASFFEI